MSIILNRPGDDDLRSQYLSPRFYEKKKKEEKIIIRPFFDKFKLCKIPPKFAMIMQTVQKYK